MAEHAAHLTTTLQAKPSIFEVVAADSLQATFHPAIQRLCNILANAQPQKFNWLVRYFDEFYLIINGLIQQYYIRVYGGTISEIFYDLRRSLFHTEKLSYRTKRLIFISVVILPYIRTKIEKLLKKWNQQIENTTTQTEIKSIKTKKRIIRSYQLLTTIYDCLQIYQFITYMSNASKSHSILLRLMQMNLVYLSPDSLQQDWAWTDFLRGNVKFSTMLSTVIFRGLELSAFFLQFVQWWQNEANHGNITNLPVPLPPMYDVNSEKYQSKCPICFQCWEIPTVLTVSGYVYCYKCIVKHLDENQQCPITNYPASIDDLLRIYDD